MLKIAPKTVAIYRNSESNLIKPMRWCSRNISRLTTTPDGSPLKKIGKKISHIIVAIFSAIALAVTAPLASIGIVLELIRNKRYANLTSFKDLANHQLKTMTPQQLDQDWKLKEFFGQIYVINLEHAEEKRKVFTDNAKKVGLNESDFKFFKATYGKTELPKEVWDRVDNNYCQIETSTEEGRKLLDKQHQGQAGCFMSHYRVIKEAKQAYEDALKKVDAAQKAHKKSRSAKSAAQLKEAMIDLQKKSQVFIMEDDNAFGNVINEEPSLYVHNRLGSSASTEGVGTVFRQGLTELPDDWEMLYLHSYQIFPNWEGAANTKICELKGGLTCNAFVVNAKAFDKILKRLEKIEKGNAPLYPVDDEFAAMHKEGYIKAYGFHPSITFQNCMGQSAIADNGDQVAAQKNCWQPAEWGRPAVTYAGDGQRFGDRLINYIKALYVADQHKLPLVYRPFKYSDQLALSRVHVPSSQIEKKYTVKSNKLEGYDPERPLTVEKWNELVESSKALFGSLKKWKSSTAHLYEVSFFTPDLDDKWDNDHFRNLLRSLIKPVNPLPAIAIPADCCSVALHVRKGGGFDSSETIKASPTKFPTDDFYLNAIKYLAEQHKGKKMFVHLFTDDPNPQAIADKYNAAIKHLGIENEVEIGFRKDQNSHDSNVLEDFFAMTQFDCLVRGDSSFSQAVEAISGPRISITPPAWDGWKQRDSQGNVITDSFKVKTRAEKGKGTAQTAIVSV